MPSSGSVRVRGRILPFIELGAGFNPELTGKENIFLYGTLLGLSKEEIMEKYEQTVEFAELGNFIDTKFKNYSSGMQARLSFSTALMINPDILLIDEVLSVGDSSFQQRCINRIIDFKHEKKTILFVSHNLDQVRQICNRVILLDKGEIIMQEKAEDV
ncbi:MAG: ATP-binding cassette domain-containing protein, partial [Candidatus Woesearchaeota archaeon]|nr:ATP-binding cassette domain-containing protein [Candidatus Woesearchaeota archaeon]